MKRLMRSDEKGFLLLTVIITIVVLSAIVIGIMNLNVSRVKVGQSVSDQLRAEEMAKGVFLRYYQASFDNSEYDPSTEEAELGSKSFLVEDFSDTVDGTDSSYNEIMVRVGQSL